MPTAARISASGVISNKVNPCNPSPRVTPSTSRFVDVPIRVQTPPMIATYDKGISSFDGRAPIVAASWVAMGIRIRTTGVLFMNADASKVNTARPAKVVTGFVAADLVSACVAASSAPVRTSAPEMMNIAAIAMGAKLESAVRKSSLDRTPVASRNAAPEIATVSVE